MDTTTCTTFSFPSVTGLPLDARRWAPAGEPVGILQLVHGMAEHIDRYDWVARQLAAKGWLVVGHTHLGHGENAPIKGYFADQKGWQCLIDDVHTLRTRTAAEFPTLPYVILGHSMGSFVTRCYLTQYGQGLAGCVLSGTGYFPPVVVMGGLAVANLVCLLGGGKKSSPLINAIGFSGNNKAFAPNRTDFDWLTRDEAQVDKYCADPLCGFLFTGSGYRDMFRGLKRLNDLPALQGIPSDLPVLFLSGEKDPIGSMGQGVETVAAQFRSAGLQQVTVKLFPEGRHELFNELNR